MRTGRTRTAAATERARHPSARSDRARAGGSTIARPRAAQTPEQDVDPAFHRAILKIALELKKPRARGYDTIVEGVIRSMRLDAVAFRRFLGENGARNMSLLLATARGSGL